MTGKKLPGLCMIVIKFEVDTSSGVDVGAISRRAGVTLALTTGQGHSSLK